MMPECCKNCKNLLPGGECAAKSKGCARWRDWFRLEWARIRRAADKIKQKRRQHHEQPHEHHPHKTPERLAGSA